jgi:hypothetical protein
MPASQHTIAGAVLTMPVQIRTADHRNAMFSVDADAAQRLIDYSGLQVCRYLPGRAVINLILTRFTDGDLGRYHEFTIGVMVNPPSSNVRGLGRCNRQPRSCISCRSITSSAYKPDERSGATQK